MKRSGLMVGGFTLGALALIVLAVVWLGGESLFSRPLRAVIYFQGGVAGLSVGAPVTFRGVPVGQVDDIGIELDAATVQARIPVRVRLQPDRVRVAGSTGQPEADLAALVKRGLRARLVAQSFVTGQKAIDLDFAETPPAVPPTAANGLPEIPAVADRFDALFDQVAALPLRETVEEVRQTLRMLQDTLVQTRKTLASAGRTLDTSTAEVTKLSLEGRRTLASATTALDQIGTRSATTLATADNLLKEAQRTLQQAGPDLQATLASAREAADSARQAMQQLNAAVEPGAPARADAEAAMRDLARSARTLRDLSDLLDREPNAIVFGREQP